MRKIFYSLYGHLLSLEVLRSAYKKVKRSNGAAGIDGQSLSDFDLNCLSELTSLLLELKEKRYRPFPVKRVLIPKLGGGERALGIPTVRDRIVQQALLTLLEPIFDADFHPSSYGYRKGRSCHQAIAKASLFIRQYNRKWVVDLDLSRCFDTLDHQIILAQFKKRISDGSILKLLDSFLKSGVMIGSDYLSTEVGSPQGGVISPLIANVYLDQYDQFMKARGHRIVRYADDILVLCASRGAAENALRVTQAYLEQHLKLQVNEAKTHIIHSDDGVRFLGVEIFTDYTRIQDQKLNHLKHKVKKLTKRNTVRGVSELIEQLNPLLRGFVNYYRVANCKGTMRSLMQWLRRRLRAIQLSQWKKSSRLHRRLKQLGFSPPFKHIKMRSWRGAKSPLASFAMPNKWFHSELGLIDLATVTVGVSVQV